MKKRKVLVTGGTGFIGAALVKKLLAAGHFVRVFDNNFRGKNMRLDGFLDKLDLIEGDIRDEEMVMNAVKGMDMVYHLAFINGTKHFYEIPDLVLDVGVRGALNTLKASLEYKPARYILASSSEVYQMPTRIPTDESERIFLEDVKNPRYSYAGGKIISELLTLNYLRKSKTEAVIFRPHNIFGPDMGWEHVIPEILVKIGKASDAFKEKKAKIEIQGSGEETRAFCYVDSAVDQIVLCAEKGGDGEIYHIGEMNEISILALIEMIGNILGIEIETVSTALRKGGTPRRCPDISKIKTLGYVQPISFNEGLRRTVLWYKREIR